MAPDQWPYATGAAGQRLHAGANFTPSDNKDGFKNQAVLAGVTSAADDHAGRFVILLEPLADGKIGRGARKRHLTGPRGGPDRYPVPEG